MKDLNILFDSGPSVRTWAWFLVIMIMGVNSSILLSEDIDKMRSTGAVRSGPQSRELFDELALKAMIETNIAEFVRTSTTTIDGTKAGTCVEIPANPSLVVFPNPKKQTSTETGIALKFSKCPIGVYRGDNFILYYRVEALGNDGSAGAEVVVALQKNAESESHDAEFIIKSTIRGRSSKSDKKSADSQEELMEFKLQLREKLSKVFEHITLISEVDLQSKILNTLDPLLVLASQGGSSMNSLVKSSYPIKKMVCVKKVTTDIKVECSVEKQTMFEMLIEPVDDKSGTANILLQLGAIHFSAKVPLFGYTQNSQSQFEEAMKEFKDGVTKWITETPEKDYQMVELNQASSIIVAAFTQGGDNSCFDAKTNKDNGEAERYTNFSIRADRKDAGENCKPSDKLKIPDFVNILFFSYQFGYTSLGHLYLDSEFQTAEYLVDLNEEGFKKTVTQEIQEYLQEIKIELTDSKEPIPALTTESIAEYISAGIGEKIDCKTSTAAQNSKPSDVTKKTCYATNKKSQIAVEITPFQNPDFVFKVRFFYTNTIPTTKKAAVLTNQIVLQKFNTFNQLKRLDSSIEELKAQLP